MQGSWSGLSGEPFCSAGTVPHPPGDQQSGAAAAGLAAGSGYQVVSGGVCQWTALTVRPCSQFHTLRNCCPPGFYQDNIECPYFTSEMFSSDVQLGRGSPAPQIVASVPSSRGCVSTKRRNLLRVVAFASLLEPCLGSQLLTLPLGPARGGASVVCHSLYLLCASFSLKGGCCSHLLLPAVQEALPQEHLPCPGMPGTLQLKVELRVWVLTVDC